MDRHKWVTMCSVFTRRKHKVSSGPTWGGVEGKDQFPGMEEGSGSASLRRWLKDRARKAVSSL